MRTSNRIAKLGVGVFDRNDRRKSAYRLASSKSQLPPLVDLSLGSTDLSPPLIVLEAIEKTLRIKESSSYCLHAATNSFRVAVAEWCHRRFDIQVDSDREVLLLVGSQEGLAHLPLAVLNPGERGLILDPSYPSHLGGLVLANARVEKLRLSSQENWLPDFRGLSNSQWDHLGMFMFGFPHNPTAKVGEQGLLDEVMAHGVHHDFVVAHDNPYVDLAIDGEAPALLRSDGWKECGIEFFSFSKAWCMGGFRIAFAVGAEPVITALKKVKGIVDFNQSLALQRGAIAALEEAPEWPEMLVGVYRERRDKTIDGLRKIGWNVPLPSMSLYLWMPIPIWAEARGWNDEEFAKELLAQTGIALTPGSGFGDGGSGWLRMALVRPVDELELAVADIATWWNEKN